MSKRNCVLAICAVIAFGLVATQSSGKRKHAHGTLQVYASSPIVTPAGGVGSGTAFCPPGTAITGGGEQFVAGLATIDMGFTGNAYYAIVDNFDNATTSQINVQAACTAGTTRVRARPLSRAQVRSRVAAMVAEREAAHRAQP